MKDFWIALLLAAIVITKAADLLADRTLQLPSEHLLQEAILLVLSTIGCLYLIIDIRRRTLAQRALRRTLTLTDARLASLGEELRRARSAYAKTIRSQFEAWELTRVEQEVAMLLLKGLSLKEIAVVRDSREKTVRQQASRIYAKGGLEGRHALAAWFLEDFIAGDLNLEAHSSAESAPQSIQAPAQPAQAARPSRLT